MRGITKLPTFGELIVFITFHLSVGWHNGALESIEKVISVFSLFTKITDWHVTFILQVFEQIHHAFTEHKDHFLIFIFHCNKLKWFPLFCLLFFFGFVLSIFVFALNRSFRIRNRPSSPFALCPSCKSNTSMFNLGRRKRGEALWGQILSNLRLMMSKRFADFPTS